MEAEEKPLVSVIIPTYNRGELISRTLESALAQSHQNIEVIVVDDASTDNTRTVIERFIDPRIKYFCLEKNSGPSTARNTGVELAQGQFVTFLDSDDEWNSQKIERQLAAIRQQADPGNVVCYTRALIVQDNSTYLLPTRGKYKDEPVGDFILCGSVGLIHTSSLMLALDLALANPFPVDQKIFEDWDLFLRLEERGVNWLYLDQPLITWNNQSREDRLTQSEHDGSLWLEEHKHYLSKNAQNAFSLKGIIRPLIQSRQRKLYSLKLLVYTFPGNDISVTQYLKLMLKIFLSPTIVKQLKAFAPFHSRQQMNS